MCSPATDEFTRSNWWLPRKITSRTKLSKYTLNGTIGPSASQKSRMTRGTFPRCPRSSIGTCSLMQEHVHIVIADCEHVVKATEVYACDRACAAFQRVHSAAASEGRKVAQSAPRNVENEQYSADDAGQRLASRRE